MKNILLCTLGQTIYINWDLALLMPLMKKYKKEVTAKIIAVNPLEFVSSEELQ